jgi:hypothetical protein
MGFRLIDKKSSHGGALRPGSATYHDHVQDLFTSDHVPSSVQPCRILSPLLKRELDPDIRTNLSFEPHRSESDTVTFSSVRKCPVLMQ